MHATLLSRVSGAAVVWAAALASAAAPAAAQEISGPDVWAANCGNCHRLRAVDTYTASQWNTIATHMALVARLTPAETKAVREFLVGSAHARQAAAMRRELMPDVSDLGSGRSEGGANALGEQPARAGAANAGGGSDIYRSKCAACHGPEGRGNGPAAAAMNPRPTDFTDAAKRLATTDSAMADVIRHGRRSMPAFGSMLSASQVDSVIAYVKTLHR